MDLIEECLTKTTSASFVSGKISLWSVVNLKQCLLTSSHSAMYIANPVSHYDEAYMSL